MPKVIIRCAEESAVSFADYLIYMDDANLGVVSSGEPVELSLSPGSHKLKIKTKLRLAASPLINFHINENETKEFEIKSNSKTLKFALIPFAVAVVYQIIKNQLSATFKYICAAFAILFVILLI